MNTINKTTYESPKLNVQRVTTEEPIAMSPVFSEDLGWKQDTDPPAPYDGDIWVNF